MNKLSALPINYQRIAKAIEYLLNHYKNQPTLEEIAQQANISPYHFQKIFTHWAGVSPKKFLQYVSLKHAQEVLKNKGSIMEATDHCGLSGAGRLHDLFVTIEHMTPGEYKKGGLSLHINYFFYQTPFGTMLVASTYKGICFMAFKNANPDILSDLRLKFPAAILVESANAMQEKAVQLLNHNQDLPQLKLHLQGTPFQLKVWEALLQIPHGQFSTYSEIAQKIGQPKASRAVGSAVGSNLIAYLIPCHRVIQSSGILGNYKWGAPLKAALLGWEANLSQHS